MGFYGWELATVFSKLFIYLGISSAVGGVFIALMVPQHRILIGNVAIYCRLLISLALIATLTNFFIQVGAFAESGLSGMLDEMFIEMLWQSNVGDSALFMMLGLVLMLISSLLVSTDSVKVRYIAGATCAVSLVILTKAFTLVGHTAQLSFSIQVLLGIHLSIAAWWMGALWPLWRACHDVPNAALHQLMEKFGVYAAISVLVLIVCGTILGFQLIGSFDELFFTDYGRGVSLKLFTVSLILLVAAYHKWKLVPALLIKQSSDVLARSIVIEMYLGVTVLGITTVASTLMGPVH